MKQEYEAPNSFWFIILHPYLSYFHLPIENNDNKSSFVAAMGEEAYNNKIIELLKKLLEPQGNRANVNRENNEDGGEDETSENEEE